MLQFIILLFLVCVPVFLVLDIKLSEGKLNKAVKRVNIAAAIIIAALIAAGYIVFRINKSDSYKYQVHGNALLGGITYDHTEDGYYIFKEARFLAGAEFFAVPASADDLPLLSKLSISMLIYTDGEEIKEIREFSSGKYPVWTNVMKIGIQPSLYVFLAVMLILALLLVFNFIVFIAVISTRNNKQNESAPGE